MRIIFPILLLAMPFQAFSEEMEMNEELPELFYVTDKDDPGALASEALYTFTTGSASCVVRVRFHLYNNDPATCTHPGEYPFLQIQDVTINPSSTLNYDPAVLYTMINNRAGHTNYNRLILKLIASDNDEFVGSPDCFTLDCTTTPNECALSGLAPQTTAISNTDSACS